MNFIDIPGFIKAHITRRDHSLFLPDMMANEEALRNSIQGKSVLVIGGAGTIGLSFIKAILDFAPGRLYIVDVNENGLTEVSRDLRSTYGQYIPKDYKTYPMNFGDDVFRRMYEREGPFDIVANFAAHKHVRSEKDHYAIEAMLENNVVKTRNFLSFLAVHKPEHFFCVSTDKAVNPVNVMGASKKLMEEVLLAYSDQFKITTARFANVAFSNGSLLDGYIHRLSKQQPVSCPDNVSRFFVSPEESGQICLLACMLGKSGEIFFPRLAEKDLVNFKSITRDFFTFIGMEMLECTTEEEAKALAQNWKPNQGYPAYFFSSDTTGEKLFEEFYTEKDNIDLSRFSSLGIIRNPSRYTIPQINECLTKLNDVILHPESDKSAIIAIIKELVPDFDHSEKGLNLDQKM
jgi:FlaA1/EpsC-like NDP-sugar epimerase